MKRCTLAKGLLSAHATAWPAWKAFAQGPVHREGAAWLYTHTGLCESPRLRAGYVVDPIRGDTGGGCNHDSIVVNYYERLTISG